MFLVVLLALGMSESVLGSMRLLAGMFTSMSVGDAESTTRSVVGAETVVGLTSVWVEAAENLDFGSCENLLVR